MLSDETSDPAYRTGFQPKSPSCSDPGFRIRSRWTGKTCAIDLFISVDPALATDESHDIADKIESIIEKRFDTSDISIHVEPENNQ
ncbi:MAG: hypothetical protein JSW45_11870 [Thiotrichales bacterium]|nr:MAG: hypothetical protein JSW45_11870 [Thiotrichales bacterium]